MATDQSTDGLMLDVVDSEASSMDWETIADHLKRSDENMIKGLSSKINNLLLFAGLSSAVLTGFITLSFPWLNQDYAQSMWELLCAVVAQSTDTVRTLLGQSSSFRAPGFAVWINVLWFLSLMESLVAAFFGVLVTQWLSSRMQWTNFPTSHRALVASRQHWYEAFLDWKVPVIATAIPICLICSTVKFLVGLAITLIYMTNWIVASVGITVIVIVILLVVGTIILPIIDHSCPLRSPISEAFVAVPRDCAQLWKGSGTLMKRSEWTLHIPPWDGVDASLETINLRTVLPGLPRLPLEELHGEAARVFILSRALVEVRMTSQDRRVLAAVDACSGMRTSDRCDVLSLLEIDFLITCKLLRVKPDALCAYIDDRCLVGDDTDSRPSRRVWDLRVSDIWRELEDDHRFVQDQIRQGQSPLVAAQLAQFLILGLLAFFGKLQSRKVLRIGKVSRLLMRHLVLASLLMHEAIRRMRPTEIPVSGRLFVQLFQQLGREREVTILLPAFRTLLFEYITKFEMLTGGELVSERPRRAVNYAQLAIKVLGRDHQQWISEDCDLFIRISSKALRYWRRGERYGDYTFVLDVLLERMAKCALVSFANRWKNCGSSAGLQLENGWFWPLYNLFHPGGPDFLPDLQSIFPFPLIDALEQCERKGLLTTGGYAAYLDPLSALSRELMAPSQSLPSDNAPDSSLDADSDSFVVVDASEIPSSGPDQVVQPQALYPPFTVPFPSPALSRSSNPLASVLASTGRELPSLREEQGQPAQDDHSEYTSYTSVDSTPGTRQYVLPFPHVGTGFGDYLACRVPTLPLENSLHLELQPTPTPQPSGSYSEWNLDDTAPPFPSPHRIELEPIFLHNSGDLSTLRPYASATEASIEERSGGTGTQDMVQRLRDSWTGRPGDE